MEAIHDLGSVGEVLVGKIPDPLCPIAKHDTTGSQVEPSASGLTLDTRREFARDLVGIPLCCALDCG